MAALLAVLIAAQSVLVPSAEASVWTDRPANQARTPISIFSLQSTINKASMRPESAFTRISPSLGQVRTVAAPPNPSGTILLVQDIHLHAEAQAQISRLVSTVGPNVSFVGLEAAFGPLALDTYARFPHHESVAYAADYLLEKFRISGAAHGGLVSNTPIALVGIDESSEYHRNVAAVRESDAAQEKASREWNSRTSAINQGKRAAFNPRLLAFDESVSKYREGRTGLAGHVEFLTNQLGASSPACELFLKAIRLESRLDLERVAGERRAFVVELTKRLSLADADHLGENVIALRLGHSTPVEFHRFLNDLAKRSGLDTNRYPALQSYLAYLELADLVRPEIVLADVERLEAAGFERFAQTSEERALLAKSEFHHLTGQLLSHTLRPTEWARYLDLKARTGDDAIPGIAGFENFYSAAAMRDASMAENMIGELSRRHAREAMMVVGGYHVPGLTERLAAAGYRVLTFTPAISSIDDKGAGYLSAFLIERTPLERLFRAPRLTLAPAPVPFAVGLAELPALVAAGETIAGRLSGDATSTVRTLAPTSGVTASAQRHGTDADLLLSLSARKWRLGVTAAPSGRIIKTALAGVDASPLTPSLVANFFSDHPGQSRWWAWLNVPVRILLAVAIVPHELGHLFVGPANGRRLEFGWQRILGGLFYGMPWHTRGPPALAGIIVNFSILIVLVGVIATFNGSDLRAHPALFTGIVYVVLANLVFVAGEIILTPFARRLGLSASPDLYFLENGEIFHSLRAPTGSGIRKHLSPPDFTLVPARFRADAARAVEELSKRRPLPGHIQFVNNYPDNSGNLHETNEFVAWNNDGDIFIRMKIFDWLGSQSVMPQFPVPPRESAVFRGLVVHVLHAAFQYHRLNQHPTVALQSDFEHWEHEADERFKLESTVSSYELLDQYEQQFESPKTMAVEKIRWAAHVLGISPVDTTQLVEPDWTYRFEIPVPLDKGGTPAVVVAWRTQHNDALGQNKGGLRYVPGLDDPTVGDLSREMTIKVAVVNLPLGGGKGGARLDPKLFSPTELAHFTRGFVRELHRVNAIGPEIDVPAPDMNTGAETMAWIADEYIRQEISAGRITHPELLSIAHQPATATAVPVLDKYVELWERGEVDGKPLAVVTGKPVEVVIDGHVVHRGGIIGREEATARGGYFVALEAVKHYMGRKDIKGLRVSIQGFGNVGYWMAKILYDAGAHIVSISEIRGVVHRQGGINIDALKAHFDAKKTFEGYVQDGAEVSIGDSVGDQPLYAAADILIPAAREKQIRTDNVDQIHPDVKLIIELANGPTTPGAEDRLKQQRPGVVIIPDVLANAGGVTVSHFEWQRNMGQIPKDISLENVRERLRDVMVPAARELFAVADSKGISPRESTYVVAVRRVHQKANSNGNKILTWLLRQVNTTVTSSSVLFGLMPWFTAPAYTAAVRASAPGAWRLPALAASLGGFAEDAALRPVVQTVLTLFLSTVAPTAWLPVITVVLYAGFFATIFHPTVVRPGGAGRPEAASIYDRIKLFAFALGIGVLSNALPFGNINFVIVGVIHGAMNGSLTFLRRESRPRSIPTEAEAARKTVEWMEGRLNGQSTSAPIDTILASYGPAELDQTIRFIDGRVKPSNTPHFNAALFEQELARRIKASPSLGARSNGDVLRLLRDGLALSAEAIAAHPASIVDGRLTAVVIDENMSEGQARKVIDSFISEQKLTPSGTTVISIPPSLLSYAASRASEVANVTLLPVVPTVGGVVALADLEAMLRNHRALENATSVRIAVAGNLRVETAGLDSSSPLRQALILLIDETLRSVAFTTPRLETMERIAHLVSSQA